MDLFDDFFFRHEFCRGPLIRVADIHVLDKAHAEAILP